MSVRARTSDVEVLHQLVLRRELDFSIASRPRRILDGGANIGLASRWFLECWPDAEIVAVELDAGNCRLAEQNLKGTSVRLMNAGLWCRLESLSVANPQSEPYARQAATSPVIGTGVRGVTLEALLDELGWDEVDLVKLDIEGAEVEVLQTAAAWLPRIRCLALELHDRFRPGCTEAMHAALEPGRWAHRQAGEYHVFTRVEG